MLTLAINRGPLNVNALAVMPKTTAAPMPTIAATSTHQVTSDVEREQAAVRAVLAGDANAFQPLIEAHQSRVYSLALRMLGNEREAEDAAQDAFVHAYARLASYKPEWRFKTWIMTITSNLCIDRLRRRKLEPTSFTDHSYRASADDDGEVEFVSYEPQPDAVVVRRQRDVAIQAMLNELPIEDRGMVAMFYFNDQSYEDIARAMNTTVSAVKSRLFRARQKMAQSKWVKMLGE